jgi:UDP-N-acetylglucosamine pyrophosphorylase
MGGADRPDVVQIVAVYVHHHQSFAHLSAEEVKTLNTKAKFSIPLIYLSQF